MIMVTEKGKKTKQCKGTKHGCGEFKLLSEFHKRKSSKDGYGPICKHCVSKQQRAAMENECIDCGKIIRPKATRCHSCYSANRRYPPKTCIDCGAVVSNHKETQRCIPCGAAFRKSPDNICVDCGKIHARGSERCRACGATKAHESMKKEPNACVDCGKKIRRDSTRCKVCWGKSKQMASDCPDCGKPKNRKADRCRKCAGLNKRITPGGYRSTALHQLKTSLRNSFALAVGMYGANTNYSFTKRTGEIIGITWKEFIMHIQKQFTGDMTWDNHGIHTWHFDHIIPVSAYGKLILLEEWQEKCYNYRNIRPFDAEENLTKRATLDLDLIEEYGIADLLPFIKPGGQYDLFN